MNMESSRSRSIDRSRERGALKKPRLAEESDCSIPFQPRLFVGSGSTGSLLSRIRATKDTDKDDEREDSARSPNKKQNQELFAQYKTALAELTFNSKPIITNLTIIAGENLHAAKGIVAMVCANIIEVPSEQKLPSLYLLDSIVKNIGRDYIKHFAARLPEVFCKAYGQVDSSIHSGMRHLFGTWKGVFPHSALQIIEKELGFTPTVNGSSSGATTAKFDSQLQHPPSHSIHVNPKYLEARQLLQQSNRAKGIASGNPGSTVIPAENTERPDRSAISGRTRPLIDPPVKMHKIQRHQREQLNEPVRESPGAGYGDYEFMSDLPSQPHSEIGRPSERVTERGLDKLLSESGNAADKAMGRRNGFENTHFGMGRASERVAERGLDKPSESGNAADEAIDKKNGFENSYPYGNHQSYRSAPAVTQVQPVQGIANRSGRGTSRNWKHSEEEEYMWDNMNSRLTDHGGADSSWEDGRNTGNAERSLSLQRGKFMPLETEFTDTRWNTLETLSRLEKPSEAEDRVPLEREFEDSLHQARNQHNIGSRFSKTSTDSLFIKQGGQTTFGHRTPSVWPFQEPHSLNGLNQLSTDSIISSQSEGHLSPGSSSLSKSTSLSVAKTGLLPPCVGPSTRAFHSLSSSDHCHQFIPQSNKNPSQISGLLNQTQHMQVAKDSLPFLPQNHVQPSMLRNLPFSPSPKSQPPQHLQNSLPSNQLTPHLPFFQQPQPDPSLQQTLQQTQSQPSGSGHFNNTAACVSEQSNSSSSLAAIMKSVLAANYSVTSNFKKPNYLDTAMTSHLNSQPPLPNGPPPIQQATPSVPIVPTTSVLCATSLSDISAPAANTPREILPPLPPGLPPPSFLDGDTSSQLPKKGSTISNLLSSLVAKGLISSTATEAQTVATCTSSALDKIPFSESAKNGSNLSQTRRTEMKDLIGFEFKPEIIRELHPLVINALFNDLPHQCNICGLRHKHQEMLGKHLDWHASNKHEQTSHNKISRKWYPSLSEWVAGNVGPQSSMEKSASVSERNEPMVPADDVHIICALCGEPFEDFYSQERDEWMYKGTVYMTTLTCKLDIESDDECGQQVPIVHTKCISKSSMDDLEVS